MISILLSKQNDKWSNVQTLPKQSKYFLQEQSFWFLIASIVFDCSNHFGLTVIWKSITTTTTSLYILNILIVTTLENFFARLSNI